MTIEAILFDVDGRLEARSRHLRRGVRDGRRSGSRCHRRRRLPDDVAAAARLGMSTIALRGGSLDDRMLNEAGAVAVFDSPADLLTRDDRSSLAAA